MRYFRKSLRNSNIDYSRGLFFVTFQVSWNKSLLGAIVGDRVVLNAFGQEVERLWRELPGKYPELKLHAFVFMLLTDFSSEPLIAIFRQPYFTISE